VPLAAFKVAPALTLLPEQFQMLTATTWVPLEADEHWEYFTIRPVRGEAWMPSRRCGTGTCRQRRPENTSSAQCHGFFGRAFFCLLFFRASKEK
jgi:hypothetical protein